MLIYLLNLERSKGRLAEFASINRHLTAISRVPAVDGASLDIPALVQRGVIAEGLLTKDFYTVGAIGAAMSHISLWQTATEANDVVTITEDDAILHSAFEHLAPAMIAKLPPHWDLISWGWNFDLFMCFEMLPGVSYCLAQFEQDRLRASAETFQQQPVAPQAFRLKWKFGIPCYSLTPKGARALQQKCLPLRPTTASFPPAARVAPHTPYFRNVGIDSAMNNAWADINAYVCVPPLVISKNDTGRSTIQQKG
jgi:GR25 family glycosyltransferase involved in LPS biosynthesis